MGGGVGVGVHMLDYDNDNDNDRDRDRDRDHDLGQQAVRRCYRPAALCRLEGDRRGILAKHRLGIDGHGRQQLVVLGPGSIRQPSCLETVQCRLQPPGV